MPSLHHSLCHAVALFTLMNCTPSVDSPLALQPPDNGTPTEEPDLAASPDLAQAQPDLARPLLCTGKPSMAPGTTLQMMTSRGQQRKYLLHVPAKYDPSQPTELVFAFHGLSDKAAAFMKYIDVEREADSRNLIVIVPQGLGAIPGWNAGNCCGEPQLFRIDDVGFVRDLIDAARRDLCIDDKRIFAMGFSNGAMFSHRLACELAGTISAVGPVSGSLMVSPCTPTRPVALLHMHGTADPIVGYHGGGSGSFPDIPTMISDWAKRDGCTGAPLRTYENGTVTCQTYGTCADHTAVSLCTIEQGKHTWPGSPDGTKDINGTQTILDFFARHGR